MKPQITQIFTPLEVGRGRTPLETKFLTGQACPLLLTGFIVGFWVVMMGLLIQKEFLPKNILPQKIRFPGELPYVRNWGIYTKEEKIGYLKNEYNGYLWKSEAVIKILGDMSISINSRALFNNDQKLENFQITLSYEDLIVDIAGMVEGNIIKLKVGKTMYTLPWASNMDLVNNTMIPWFYIQDLKVGDRFKWYILNPLTRTKDLVKTIVRRTSFYYNKKDFVPVTVVDMYYQDMKFEFWIDKEGEPLKVDTPWGWELETE